MKNTLLHGMLMAVLLGGAIIVYGAWYAMVSSESHAVAILSEEIAIRDERVQQSSIANSALRKLESSKSELENYFVSEKNIVAFLAELEKIGARLGSTVQVVSVGVPTEGSTRGEQVLSIILLAEGSFDAVMRTLGAIEHAPYTLSFTGITLELDDGETPMHWHATFTIAVGLAVPTATTKSTLPAPATTTSP